MGAKTKPYTFHFTDKEVESLIRCVDYVGSTDADQRKTLLQVMKKISPDRYTDTLATSIRVHKPR